MKEIRKIVKATPRASYANPAFKFDSDGNVLVYLGSNADCCRVIDALRSRGYDCNFATVYFGEYIVRVNI